MRTRGFRDLWRCRPIGAALTLAVVALGLAWAPVLPTGADTYVHLLWTHQVMRCLAHWDLPLWCPDLNAGFGSPGIRLYSPAGPVLSGAVGLIAGDAGRGLRLALMASVALLAFLARRREETWPALVGLVALSPAVAADLLARGAWSQVLAVPLAWWLLEEALASEPAHGGSWRARSVVVACLWLVHAPTMLMTGLVAAAAVLARRDRRAVGRWGLASCVSALLTAWHWLPLLDEMRLVGARADLVEGIFVAADNILGSAVAHAPDLNLGLSAAAVSLVLCAAPATWQSGDRRRLVLILGSVALASPLAVLLWRPGSPLEWLQFPWRFLLPATLLTAGPVSAEIGRLRPRGLLLALLWLAPLLVVPNLSVTRAPSLSASAGRDEVGKVIEQALGGNPLLVDAAQNRPEWYDGLGESLLRFGSDRRVAADGLEQARVLRWTPLHREVELRLQRAGSVELRLLWYPWWEVELDGGTVAAGEKDGVVSIPASAGTHLLSVRWRGNPLSRVGLALAVGGILALAWRRRRDD